MTVNPSVYSKSESRKPFKAESRKSSKAPIARWTFDEGSGEKAISSSGDCNGIIHGASWTEGKFGGALDFDGQNDYVSIGYLGSYDALTISMWINIDSLRDGDENNLLNSVGWEEGDPHINITVNGQLFYSQLVAGMEEIAESSSSRFTREDFGQWRHVAIAYDSIEKGLSFYIDGELDSKNSLELSGPVELGPFRIACHNATNHIFDGQIDDVQIYGYALDDKQIARVYSGKVIEKPTNIIPVLVIGAVVLIIALVGASRRKKTK